MRLTIPDLLFVTGVLVALSGCWLTSLPLGLIGTGLALCVAARVVHALTRRPSKT